MERKKLDRYRWSARRSDDERRRLSARPLVQRWRGRLHNYVVSPHFARRRVRRASSRDSYSLLIRVVTTPYVCVASSLQQPMKGATMNESEGTCETECPSKVVRRGRRSKVLRWLVGKRSRWVTAAVVVASAFGLESSFPAPCGPL